MKVYTRTTVPEKYKTLREKKLMLVVLKRFEVIIPALLLFLLVFVVIDLETVFWGDHSRYYFVLDMSGLLSIVVIAVLFYKNKIENTDDVSFIHHFIRNSVAFLIMLWAAFAGVHEYAYAGANVAFLICLMVCGSLFLLNIVQFSIICTIAAIVFLIGIGGFGSMKSAVDLFFIVIVFGFSMLVNTVNKSALTRAFIMEWELEAEVDKRTRALKLETEKALQSEIMKSTFLANMSHEIRTPLNAILGFSKLILEDKDVQDSKEKYLNIIINSGENLLDIVNEIIEVSRLEAGACEVFYEEFDIIKVFTNAVELFGGNEKINSGMLVLENDNQTQFDELYVKTDKFKIVQILNNLIGNAVKYTDSGKVSLSFGVAEDSVIRITVADTGRGIAAEQLENIFNRFQQVSEDPYGRKDGVGLGLTIVKGYVDLLGGTIEVESEAGAGTSVNVRIPLIFLDRNSTNLIK